ncbi:MULTISPECIES: Cache 3/Cache 2 fusion domain-containing protein [unclassified Modestobacter]|uniref:Cache 3/Cache 2 fusion domain-containing protein n=1 Tax=unclassified Modestobacter TaxID=2643866 RepID=UPI0022AA6A95|nr:MULTISPECIES: Cache 3/Cache 2 fusion domain-containing protein [unclassified Modestobacter]MCZ2824325.1 Cache 3/Cache 2 fusion domain-containing protein [Modestobacter sp. VKM Ac-2981]MCZ2854147.1 Cache 3/Cache 2 fusion domain-containing protein [Modestobacter sp. VKM Ac-2982]
MRFPSSRGPAPVPGGLVPGGPLPGGPVPGGPVPLADQPATAAPRPAASPRTRRPPEQDASMAVAAQQAGVLSSASREVSDTSRQAAESLTELRSAITDISSSTTRASAVAEEAVRDARAVDERIAALQEASESITEMVRLISAISQQSRFLALNAYVEAARAGDVGRGFAVVADEVKQLASRTAQAAEDIGAQIEAVQSETRQAVTAIGRITGTLGSIADAQDAIAAAVAQQRAATERVVDNVDRAASGSARITQAVAELADSQRLVYVRRALTLAQDLLDEAGGVDVGQELQGRTVTDQATSATRTVRLPELLLGGEVLAWDDDPRHRSPLVDDVVAQVGGTCTLFQRLDDAGGMVRVATTVVNSQGRRNIGTALSPTGTDGGRNPVLAAVLGGQVYTGPATVAGKPYFTAYAGVHSPAGALVGMLYVGLPIEAPA